ncbi:MAG TPA: DUF2231 domain-containing protein [Candidatus Kapabacteria bacterium]|nr:DUF2231 domain-containing protein [Candidatus Kapabacteria bacterium]
MSIGELHTVSNYFTVALVTLGIIFELTGRGKQNDGAMRYGWNSLRLGFLFALISLLTGFGAEASDHVTSEAVTSAMFHKTLGIVFSVAVLVLVIFRMSFAKKLTSAEGGAGLKGAYLTLQVITVFCLVITLFLGTRMVRTYGVGVVPVEKMNAIPVTPPPPPSSGSTIPVDTTQYRK